MMKVRRKRNRRRRVGLKLFITLLFAAACFAAVFFYLKGGYPATGGISVSSASAPDSSAPGSEPESKPESKPAQKPVSITILGAGDDLIHDSIYKQANRRAGGNGYDFGPVYQRIAGQVKSADIAVVNQETVLAGKVAPLSGYPLFNSPTEVGDELVNLGFDVINHANNHILDKGEKGIRATLDYWDTKPVKVVGAYRNDADLENIRIVEAKGVKTAHIGITEMTNGLYLPQGSDFRLIYANNTTLIEHLIKKAKSMVDVVVVSVHWGTENTYTLTETQKQLAQEMVDWGADVIFGNHPHVLQQLTVLKRSDGTECPVIYSIGNLVSSMQLGDDMVSGLLTVTETKDPATNKTTFSGMKFTPIVTHYGAHSSNITIYPLSEYSDALAKQHGIRKYTPEFSMQYIKDILNKSIPAQYLAS